MFELFSKKKEPKSLRQVLSQFKSLKEEFRKISEELEDLKKESQVSIKKVGMVRFNPFKEIGGNQSFSVALLDGYDNGIVITSFYSKDGNRVFAKPVKKGRSTYSLSKEEKKAIEKAKDIESKNQKVEK